MATKEYSERELPSQNYDGDEVILQGVFKNSDWCLFYTYLIGLTVSVVLCIPMAVFCFIQCFALKAQWQLTLTKNGISYTSTNCGCGQKQYISMETITDINIGRDGNINLIVDPEPATGNYVFKYVLNAEEFVTAVKKEKGFPLEVV